jgi:septum formation topological specificity factor MinE
LDTSLATRNITKNIKNDTDDVTKSIFQAHRKLNAKQNSVDRLKVIVSDKREIAKKASSYLAHLKSKVTEDEIKRINAEKDLLKITKAIEEITRATSELNPTDADTATFGLKASVIAKQAQFEKAEIQFHSTEKLEAEAVKRSNESNRILVKFETKFNQESSNAKRIKSNLKNSMKRISGAYADVKSLSQSLIDEAFSSDTQPVTTETIPETSVADTARRGKRFFFWS